MNKKLFCYQCRETVGCNGCTMVGGCGHAGPAGVGHQGSFGGDQTGTTGYPGGVYIPGGIEGIGTVKDDKKIFFGKNA